MAKYSGGAIYNSEDGRISIENSDLTDNNANKGGGIYTEKEDNVKIVNSQVEDNRPDNIC